ncbi:MAG: phosphatidate cytidylyltransferase [Chloroflexaceae bacterium]|jgi:phosphatidate cytidylyltransferase|nr:phosphatidate cytidylyltransferase [Chloroflexaceae bacterium]
MDGANVASAASTGKASSLGQRVVSALILLPILVGLAYWSVWTTALAVALATVLALSELYAALRQANYQPRTWVGIATGLLICGAMTFQGRLPFDPLILVIALSVLLALLAEVFRSDRSQSLTAWAFTFAGAYYVAGLLSFYVLLRDLSGPLLPTAWLAGLNLPPGAAWVFTVMAITWLQDSGAYFAGRAFGRHKMAPNLSPKKTWEGAAGGLIAGVLGAILAMLLLGLPIGYGGAVLLGVAGSIAGMLGDLAESLLKRQIGVKDAGSLIPGHGGILDRADSMLFAGPVLYMLILLLTGGNA